MDLRFSNEQRITARAGQSFYHGQLHFEVDRIILSLKPAAWQFQGAEE